MINIILIITIVAAFLITVAVFPIVIPFLKRLKFGQSIREEGPESHMKKTGTPTMGGVMILISVTLTTLLVNGIVTAEPMGFETLLLLLVLLGFGTLGFLDDFIKIVKKRNLGLTSKQKMAGQILIAVIFYFVLRANDFPTYVAIPGTEIQWDIGIGYALLILVMLVGASNAVNLTDGLDGLLAGTASIAFGAFAFLAWYDGSQMDVTVFSLSVVGALLGFLVFNAHPAKVFMGDTGSLALGGAIATIAILTKMEIILVIIGGIFVIETLSVIIQVLSFKTTGKRIFRMSPIHHHFELGGWSEWKVVLVFWAAGFLLSVFGIFIEVGLN